MDPSDIGLEFPGMLGAYMSGWLEVSAGTERRSVDRLPVGPSQMPLDALATMNCFDWALRRCLWML